MQKEDFNFQYLPLSMQSCIQRFNLDEKKAAAFDGICSSFMMSYLDDLTLSKIGNESVKLKAELILILCQQFCKIIGQQFHDSVFLESGTTNSLLAQVQGDNIHSIAGL